MKDAVSKNSEILNTHTTNKVLGRNLKMRRRNGDVESVCSLFFFSHPQPPLLNDFVGWLLLGVGYFGGVLLGHVDLGSYGPRTKTFFQLSTSLRIRRYFKSRKHRSYCVSVF